MIPCSCWPLPAVNPVNTLLINYSRWTAPPTLTWSILSVFNVNARLTDCVKTTALPLFLLRFDRNAHVHRVHAVIWSSPASEPASLNRSATASSAALLRRYFMSTTRIFSSVPLQSRAEIALGGDQAKYIGKVLRLRPDDKITLFDGTGGEYPAVLKTVSRNEVLVAVGEHLTGNYESPLSIHLLQCVSRGDRMDLVVQKATELGASQITPVLSEFSVVKLDKIRAEKRSAHWAKIAASACEQCGRNLLPLVNRPIRLRSWFGENFAPADSESLRIMLAPTATAPLSAVAAGRTELSLLIGPEGGFSPAEYEQATAAGFVAAGLGPRILRTETAAIAAIAVLQSRFGDLG